MGECRSLINQGMALDGNGFSEDWLRKKLNGDPCGKVTAKITEDSSTILGAKTARNLLTQFHHPKIGFRQIVVKRHGKIIHEPQDQVVILMQADQQIEGIAFLWCASFARAFWRGRIGRHPRLDKGGV